MYEKGDIVLVPFPFTDLTSIKTRPAVVVSVEAFEREMGNLTVAMITSVSHTTTYDYRIREWKASNLLAPSWVRAKLATLVLMEILLLKALRTGTCFFDRKMFF